ncbi:hypothetical protein GW17_00032501 [Ensete ventricosum]|nr:hypothetical protein GW17_00032501 [Ensete ventricosum]RZR98863.1 hypothetical protein BHM03_00028309 [Ensete ventricosum]
MKPPLLRSLSTVAHGGDEVREGEGEGTKERRKMDRSCSGGLSWADQWDSAPDPPPLQLDEPKKGKTEKKGKSSSRSKKGKGGGAFGWIKELCQKKSSNK